MTRPIALFNKTGARAPVRSNDLNSRRMAMKLARSRHASSGFDRRRRGNGVRLGIVAILAVLAAFLTPPGARAKSNCANWNSWSFFETAGAEDVRACLRAGTYPNARGEDGWTSLHDAAFKGHAGAVAALREAGADPNARTEGGLTPFDLIPEDSPLIGAPVHRRLKDASRN